MEDGWDWAWIWYMGIRELRLSEKELFKLTPRQFFTLINCAKEFGEMSNGTDKQGKKAPPAKIGFVDQVKW